MSVFTLSGKTALVTGASRGIGQAIAIGLAKAGARVGLVARSDCAETEKAILAAGAEATTFPTDLADDKAIPGLVEQFLGNFGKIDILVNNAGIISRKPLFEHDAATWDNVLNVNLRNVFLLSREAARPMVDAGSGKIINIASMLSFQGGILVPSYTASKTALLGLTRALCNELASANICVNAIAPGYIDTDATEALRNDPVRSKAILERIPAGRWGRPEDIAGGAVFLSSAGADYINGAVLPVDGGWLAR